MRPDEPIQDSGLDIALRLPTTGTHSVELAMRRRYAYSAIANFVAELTELGKRHGLGLEGAQVFILDPLEHRHDYVVNPDNSLTLTEPQL